MLVLQPSLFDNVPAADRQAALDLLRADALDYGQYLVEEGEELAALVYVTSGALAMLLDGYELDTVGPDQVAGALELFEDPTWLVSLKAVAPTEVLTVSPEAYTKLTATRNRVAYNLERLTLRTLTHRLRDVDGRIASITNGEPNPPGPPDPGLLQRLARLVRPRRDVPRSAGDPSEGLAKSPLFLDAAPGTLAALAKDIRVLRLREGEALFEAGDVPKGLYYVAEGKLEVRLPTGTDRSDCAAVLEPGTLVGASAMLQGDKHIATCRAREPMVAYFMPADRWVAYLDADDDTGSTVRRAVIRALAEQSASANAHVYQLHLDHLGFVREAVAGLYDGHRVW